MSLHRNPYSLAVATVLLLAACAGRAQKHAPVPTVQGPPPLDATYDWHVLLTAPFGTVFKEVPYAKHEVLLFEDAAKRTAPAEQAECYATDAKAPTFLARTPAEYLLCFKGDRLIRIRTSVLLTSGDAGQVFADACNLWLARAAGQPMGAPGAAAPAQCQGDEGGIAFHGMLDEDEGAAERTLTLTLNGSPDRN